ncbi:hypothetical protein [Kitasatospora sp. CB02891]|nr:hypothetical protein [Kitasatospora sp. CB02891]
MTEKWPEVGMGSRSAAAVPESAGSSAWTYSVVAPVPGSATGGAKWPMA